MFFYFLILIFLYYRIMLHNPDLFHCNNVIFSISKCLSTRTEITCGRSTPLDGGCAKYFYRRITEAVIFVVGLPFTRINETIYSQLHQL